MQRWPGIEASAGRVKAGGDKSGAVVFCGGEILLAISSSIGVIQRVAFEKGGVGGG